MAVEPVALAKDRYDTPFSVHGGILAPDGRENTHSRDPRIMSREGLARGKSLEKTPAPLMELPPLPRGQPLGRRFTQYLRHHRARVTAIAAVAAGTIAVGGHFLGGLAGFWEFYSVASGKKHASLRQETPPVALAQTPRPFRSVAVLPITSDSTPGDQRRAKELTQELTNAAGRAFHDGLVVSSGLAAQYNSVPRDPRKIGRELNVRYLVEGTLAASSSGNELTIEVIDSLDGARLSTERQRIAPSGDASVSLGKLGIGLRGAVGKATAKEIASLPGGQRALWSLLLRLDEMDDSITGMRKQQDVLEEALRTDPAFSPALSYLSWVLWMRLENEPENRDSLVKDLDDVTLRATRVAPADPRSWTYRGIAMRYQNNWNGAFSANDEALRIDPFKAHTVTQRAALLIYAGRPSEAFKWIDRALELDPADPADATVYRCFAYMNLKRYADAIGPCETSVARNPGWTRYMFLTAAYAIVGNAPAAEQWKTKLIKANPHVSVQFIRDMRVTDNPEAIAQMEPWLAGLRKAGIPEK